MTEELKIIMSMIETAGHLGLYAYIVHTLSSIITTIIYVAIPSYVVKKAVDRIFVDENK